MGVEVDDVGVRRHRAQEAGERAVAGGVGAEAELDEPAARPAAQERERDDREVPRDMPRESRRAAEQARVEAEAVEAEVGEEHREADRYPCRDRARDGVLLRVLADVEEPDPGEDDPPEDDREEGAHRLLMYLPGRTVHLPSVYGGGAEVPQPPWSSATPSRRRSTGRSTSSGTRAPRRRRASASGSSPTTSIPGSRGRDIARSSGAWSAGS